MSDTAINGTDLKFESTEYEFASAAVGNGDVLAGQ
jgi:hypothetical protein